ncbi:uncharacterized protein [Triticum aestivum]|uniref:uncharacterized protein n=1 Tax=Triticum aestivum TaxID=4565 RepID=UPI001D0159E1|nr:uncharacterized protein LOC123091980 [Triticum aestivum]
MGRRDAEAKAELQAIEAAYAAESARRRHLPDWSKMPAPRPRPPTAQPSPRGRVCLLAVVGALSPLANVSTSYPPMFFSVIKCSRGSSVMVNSSQNNANPCRLLRKQLSTLAASVVNSRTKGSMHISAPASFIAGVWNGLSTAIKWQNYC